ncbi:hypothetical protein PILCRDRAFT_698792 [Piloderma croceum F 1598]|uniref:BTB domain-containing protein n=1 Tax=Piloderma croceum (strain F 1598) TaxID=765440 RepID=A0A0C3BBI8_PILCF|nr:hypothetical protein PILCRDRAFT_698792 [Piloderma croceum F 1598]
MARTKQVARISTGPYPNLSARQFRKATEFERKGVTPPTTNAGFQEQSGSSASSLPVILDESRDLHDTSPSESALTKDHDAAESLLVDYGLVEPQTGVSNFDPPSIVHARGSPHTVASSSVQLTQPMPVFRAEAGAIANSSQGTSPSLKREADATAIPTEPPAKRIREDSYMAQPSFQKHRKHWDVDPLINITIERVGFKLRRSRLTDQSGFFTRLFNINLGAPVVINGVTVKRTAWEGLPLYDISSEKLCARDFETLLDAMENAIVYSLAPPPFSVAASLLRVSTILDFPTFRAFSVKRVQSFFPPNVEHVSLERIDSVEAAEAMLLGRMYDVPGIVKRASYELLRTSGLSHADPDVPCHDQMHQRSAEYINRLVTVRRKLVHFWVDWGLNTFLDSVCTSTVECTAESNGQAIHDKLTLSSGLFKEFVYDPVCGLRALIEADWEAQGFCTSCVEKRRASWVIAREKVWGQLDGWLGLPDSTKKSV